MKHPGLCSIAIFISLSQFSSVLPNAGGQEQLTDLLSKLGGKRLDKSVLYALEGHPPDHRILPALEEAFDHRQDKNEKQAIAVTLLRLGIKSDKYFDFLEG